MKLQAFDSLIPIHKTKEYELVGWEWYNKPVREYLGGSVEIYFELIRFMQKWLLVPAAFGLLTIAFNNYGGYTADNSPMDSLYALFVVLWGVFFVSHWEKKEKWAKITEANGYDESWAIHQRMVTSGSFARRLSPVTGEMEQHKGLLLRAYLLFQTCFLLTTVMVPAIIFMVLSLNARGFIDPSHKLLFWENISGWAKPGGLFDSQTNMALIPIIVHAIITNALDELVYRPIAIWSTRL